MGGSGGYKFPSRETNSEKIRNKVQRQQDKENRQKYDIEVESLLNNLLSKYNSRDTDTINKHVKAITNSLNKEIEGVMTLNYGGSVSKHTYIEGLSDIDSLVILNNTELKSKSPNEIKTYFYECLKEKFPNTEIEIGKLSVTVKFKDYDIQLLPAIKDGDDYKISSATGNNWSKIRPKQFVEKLTHTNQSNAGKVVPVIKLVKAIISNLPEDKRITSYHAESIAVKAFANYGGELKRSNMISHFFDKASEYVKSPIRDSSQQSIHVDDYLGDSNSLQRKKISDTYSRVSRRIQEASTSMNLRHWKEIFEI